MAFITSSKKEVVVKNKSHKNLSNYLMIVGGTIFLAGFLIFFFTFYPVLWQEAKYSLKPIQPTRPIKPINTDFGIVIPKILANAKVIDNVDPFNSREYQIALTKGVAHAIGTAYPGNVGNNFIFAHSSVDWYIANQYNSVFYLLYKLEKGDKINMYYKKEKFVYKVIEKKYVEANDVSFLNPSSESTSILTLMTCWPPGTTLKRLIIRAEITTK